ncbi:MAG: FHIPEP family type III secretion protein [Woeseiaceae bacterium]
MRTRRPGKCRSPSVALAPGMPFLPFTILAVGVFLLARAVVSMKGKTAEEEDSEESDTAERATPEQVEDLLPLDNLELEIGYGLIPLVDNQKSGGLLDRIRSLRKQFALEMGLVIPALHIRDNLELKPNEYAVCIKGNSIARGELMMDHYLAIDPGDVKSRVEGVSTVEPAFGLPALWVTEEKKGDAQLCGYTVVDLPSVVTTHLSEIVREHGYEFLGRQEVQRLLDNLAKSSPKAVEELVPGLLTVGGVQKVLQNLLREQVSIRDLLSIVETLADYTPVTKDPELLTEYVRQKLSRSLTKPYVEKDQTMKVLSVSAAVERVITDGVTQTEYGAYLALEPSEAERIIGSIKKTLERSAITMDQPVLLCSSTIRRHLRKLCERYQMHAVVISHNEIPSGLMVKEEMGAEAVILGTRTIPAGSKEGVGKETIEVTAAVDYDVTPRNADQKRDTGARALLERYEDLGAQIKEIRDLLWSIEAGAVLQPDTLFGPGARGQYGYYKEFGIKGDLIRSLLSKMKPGESAQYVNKGPETLKESLVNVLKNIHTGDVLDKKDLYRSDRGRQNTHPCHAGSQDGS